MNGESLRRVGLFSLQKGRLCKDAFTVFKDPQK